MINQLLNISFSHSNSYPFLYSIYIFFFFFYLKWLLRSIFAYIHSMHHTTAPVLWGTTVMPAITFYYISSKPQYLLIWLVCSLWIPCIYFFIFQFCKLLRTSEAAISINTYDSPLTTNTYKSVHSLIPQYYSCPNKPQIMTPVFLIFVSWRRWLF